MPKNESSKSSGIVPVYLSFALGALSKLGAWVPQGNPSVPKRVYGGFILSTQLYFTFCQIVYIVMVMGDMDATSEASYLLFTQLSVCYKSSRFIAMNSNTRALLQFMQTSIFEAKSVKHEKILKFHATRIRRVSMLFFVLAMATISSWAVMPLLDNADEKLLPFRVWTPVSTESTPQYVMVYIYQIVTIYISATFFNTVDGVVLGLFMFGCAQMDVVKDKLLNMGNRQENIKKNPQLQGEYMYRELCDCINHYQNIVQFITEVENTYHMNIFFQVSGSVGMICIIGLRLAVVNPNSVQFLSMVLFMLTMLTQVYTFCWCGHEITATSIEVRDAFYLCPWYEQDVRFQRLLVIAIQRMQRPIVLRVGRYIPMLLPTFVNILRSSYSYFAVLQCVQN